MGLIETLAERLSARKGGVPCPQCSTKMALGRREPILTCGTCGFRASRTEWILHRFKTESPEDQTADPDQPPANTKIVRRELNDNTIAWEVPPSGNSSGMLFFAILWTGFIALWTTLALIGTIQSEDAEGMIFPLFSLPFWAVGIGMLYFGLRAKFAVHLFLVDSKEFIMVRSFFNRKTRKALQRSTLKWVKKKEFYQQNYTPVYGIEIRGEDGKVRFGTTLTEEEKLWLVADMQRVLWPESAKPAPTAHSLASPKPSSSQGRDSFEVVFPPVQGKGSGGGLVFGFLIVGAFLAIGIFALGDAGFFRWLWLGFNSLFAIGMTAATIWAYRNRNRSIRVRGNRSEVQVAVLRDGEVLKDEHMPRLGTIDLRSYNTGHVNNDPRIRIELVGEKHLLTIAKWYPASQAAEPIAELRAKLPA